MRIRIPITESNAVSPILAAAQPKTCRNLSPHTGQKMENNLTKIFLKIDKIGHDIKKLYLLRNVYCIGQEPGL